MEKITVLNLLKAFKNLVEKDKLQFLKSDSGHSKKDVLKPLNELLSQFEKADAQKKAGKGLSDALDWHEAHKIGKKLWEQLISAALNDIDPEQKGNSQIFDYSTAATQFEELLYGLEEHYRDHTLHSLWVYLVGEHILREFLPDIHADLNWYLFNDIEKDKTSPRKLVDEARKKEKELCKKVNEHRDAIWCIMALCHDLGYSLEKLGNLNEKVRNVLKFVDLPDFQQVGYALNIEHQFHVAQFLELMAMDVRIVPSEDLKNALIKGYRDDSTYWRLCRAFEKKQHGILSAYLVYKILHVFADSWVRGPAEDWGLDDDEASENIIRGDILFAIAQHEFDFAYLNQLHSLADVLVLADELEEFSRYGRPMLSRKYYDTTADVSLAFKPTQGRQGEGVDIAIVYHMAEHMASEQVHKFFIRKAQKLCKKYSLDEKRDEKYCTIRSIKMTTKYGEKSLVFVRGRNRVYKAYLPAANIDHKAYKEGERSLTCLDDRLYIDIAEKRITIDDWFKNAQ
jgi:hypothetical protein